MKNGKADSFEDDTKVLTSSSDVKACPFPFNCFNKLTQVSNDATGMIFMQCAIHIAALTNYFYAIGLLYLAQKASDEKCDDAQYNDENCSKIWGFEPVSIVTLVWTISGFAGALFLPYIGALFDHTRYRWEIGAILSTVIVIIQAAQIYTTQSTWLVMTMLEAVNGFLFQIVCLCRTAYMTEIEHEMPFENFSKINTTMQISGLSNALIMMIIIVAVGYKWEFKDQHVAQFSQSIGAVMMAIYFYLAWYFAGRREAARMVPEHESLATAGFKQVIRTWKGLIKFYRRSLAMFLIGAIFSSAAFGGLLIVLVTYLKVSILLDSKQIGIIIIILTVCSIPGSILGHWLASKFSPLTALKISIALTIGLTALIPPFLQEKMFLEVCISAIGLGINQGLNNVLISLVFSVIVPKNQAAELGGFFTYCIVVFSWVLPLAATLLIEYGNLKWFGAVCVVLSCISLIFYSLMLPWDECVKAADTNRMLCNESQPDKKISPNGSRYNKDTEGSEFTA